uniref:alanine transaminase n=2 Tax=Zeugodacus cucurbitae TaxID=28588 RepID=A0A0A1XKE0_ZEUCU
MNRISAAVYRHWNASLANIAQAQTSRSCRLTAAAFANAKREMSSSSSQNAAASDKCLSLDNINPQFIELEYAVRGPLVIRAGHIEKELQQGVKKPFDQVIRANIGDCHAMGQKPITFLRQLLALTLDTSLFNSPDYPEDVKKRARIILDGCQGQSVGSYTDSAGIEVIRRQVANFIEKRDGIPSNWENIYLTAGATPGIKSILALVRAKVGGKRPGVMVPIPQYPLYSATISEYAMNRIGYYLNEEQNWSMEVPELERAYNEARKTCEPRALVVINPGNPTGQVLTRKNIVDVIKFAHKHKLLLLADEVYQANIYDPNSKFYSFKSVAYELGSPYREMELCSFLSTSKGYLGECGIRGGYMEVVNMCPQVQAMLTKSITAALCSTTSGQVAVSALVYPPEQGEPSYEQYIAEKTAVLNGLKERADLVYKTFNSFEGFKVNVVQGAMYAFPQIFIPAKAIAAAKAKNMSPDTFYAFELLESTGICIVPGSGFGQKEGTYHFRTTILPQTDKLKIMLDKFQSFHADFMKKYN